jgi:signal transduction histidine kinase
MSATAGGSDSVGPRRGLRGADNPLVQAVGRVRATLLAKLLVTFVGTVALLVILGVLGLQVIADSNARIDQLRKVQLRAAAYRQLQTEGAYVQQLLNLRAGGCALACKFGRSPTLPNAASRSAVDNVIVRVLAGLSGETDTTRLGFPPPADEQPTLDLIKQDYARLSSVMNLIRSIDKFGWIPASADDLLKDKAQPLAKDLKELGDDLKTKTEQDTSDQSAANQQAYVASRNLLIAVAIASIVLALLLGYVLSWSIVGPIRRMQTRLAAIASGDFSVHVAVSNRDELGALAANLNRMNDEVGRLYDELETVSRHKSEFLATMSHELRTPLNAIIGFSQVLQEQMYGELNAKQVEYVEDVLSSGQHLLNLINDILDLAKVEAGRMDLQPTTFDLPVLLENATSMVRERAIRQGISLSVATEPSVRLLEADERKVKQILFNLLSNAVKFTPAGGQVKLAARLAGEHMEISVSDTGVGITAEDQVKIFEEFYQTGSGKSQEGTGLGLALTRRLVELHHGQLSVQSELGAGSTFTVTLPLHQPGVEPPDAGRG